MKKNADGLLLEFATDKIGVHTVASVYGNGWLFLDKYLSTPSIGITNNYIHGRCTMLGQVGKYSQTFLLTSLKIFELCLNISWLRGNLYGCAEIYLNVRKFI